MWSHRPTFLFRPQQCDLISWSSWQQQWHACLFFYRRDNLTLGRRTLSGVLYCLYRLSCLKLDPACGSAGVQHDYADPCNSADRSDPRRADLADRAAASRTCACLEGKTWANHGLYPPERDFGWKGTSAHCYSELLHFP